MTMLGRWWWLVVGVYRVANALALGTAFVPDEYWQALEVAHYAVFGYGHLTWEWEHRLRGFLHPGLFAAVFALLRLFHADSPLAIIVGPRVLQGLMQAVGDWGAYALARSFFGPRTAAWALACQLLSWFTFYCGGRTLSNSLETVLVTLVLVYWPWDAHAHLTDSQRWRRRLALAIGVVAFAVRPTSAVVLAYVGLRALWFSPSFSERLRLVFCEVLPIGVVGVACSCGVDYLFYGELTFVPWNFVKFNVAHNISAFYGTHPFHWYFTQGLPTILGSFVPVFVLGVAVAARRELFYLLCWTVFVYSLLGHKEFRFIFPILPIAHAYAGHFLDWAYRRCCVTSSASAEVASAPDSREGAAAPTTQGDRKKRRDHGGGGAVHASVRKRRQRVWSLLFGAGCVVLLLTHAGMAYYFSFWHQRSPIDVMHHLRHETQRLNGELEVFFLMPCHSTPFYAYIHAPIAMDFIKCLPPITYDGNRTYADETRRFYSDPPGFLAARFEERGGRYPSHMVLFEPLLPHVAPFLARHGYHQVARFWHTLLVVDDRQGDALVFRRDKEEAAAA